MVARSKHEGRPCDIETLVGQVGRRTVLGVSGGRFMTIDNEEGETVGALFLVGQSRAVEVVLDWSDTYSVRRVRRVASGNDAGSVVVEDETTDVYCEQLSEAVWSASCWK